MGQRSVTETLFGIVAAFIEKRTWTQADLARKLETKPATIRKHLVELQAGGFKLEREEERPHVFWSVPKNWIPGALAFKADEARDLLRLIARARKGPLRDRILELTLARLATSSADFDPAAVHTQAVAPDEERSLAMVEDAAAKKLALKMRYYSASRRHESWRHVTVHRVDFGTRPHFVGTCHRANEIRRFRVSNVLDARLDPSEPARSVDVAALARFDGESFGGFHDDGPNVHCAFFVRDPEAAWVERNLPDDRITQEPATGGMRFSLHTTAIVVLARFVAGLGEIARPETPELAAEVASIARAALANALATPEARRAPATTVKAS